MNGLLKSGTKVRFPQLILGEMQDVFSPNKTDEI